MGNTGPNSSLVFNQILNKNFERLSAHTGGQKDRDRNVAFTETAKPADRTALLVDEYSTSMKHFQKHTGRDTGCTRRKPSISVILSTINPILPGLRKKTGLGDDRQE
jgi:hypothetical protein